MEITIKTKKDYHPESNKTLTIISAFIVGILVAGSIGYAIYVYKNKPATVFFPVKNKRIKILLEDSEKVKAENIQEKGKLTEAKRVLKRLTQECKDKKLVDKKGNMSPKGEKINLSEAIKKALKNGEEAEHAIKTFMEIKRASNNDNLKKEEFNRLVHKIIDTPADQLQKPPTDKQIKAARDQLGKNLKEVQTEWDKKKEGDTSYEELYVLYSLAKEYTRIKALVDQNEPQAGQQPAS
ncbi:MAG: hypothetical protein AAF900_01560 [Bacteroidota bacterium]